MTTTSEKLLQLAAGYRRKAESLELAAAELNGHITRKKQPAIETHVQQARQVRRHQRPPQKDRQGERVKQTEKLKVITELLSKAEKRELPVKELAAQARERGVKDLMGITGYVRAGLLSARGKGQRRTYRLLAVD